ncbi:MAG: APC family permease [Thermaerobacter sp.]|nr:APC family permease [Thermaerobacter sp.]
MSTKSGSLDRNALGIWPVAFQSVTFMAPGAAVAYSIYISAQYAGAALSLSVILALIGALFTAISIGELARAIPSAGSFYTYTSRALGTGPGFVVGWSYAFVQLLTAPMLYLIFGFFVSNIIQQYLHIDTSWAIWVVFAVALVTYLTYRSVRTSARTGMWLGAFEVVVFTALAITLIVIAGKSNTVAVFNPHLSLVHTGGGWAGVFQGMIYCIQAFVGFEAAVALSEETGDPRNVTKAVVAATALIGIFYVLTTYAGTVGWGLSRMSSFFQNPDPWHVLASHAWGIGWIIVFLAVMNSFIANTNASSTSATRVLFAMGRTGALPRALATVHPVFRSPKVAVLTQAVVSIVVALLLGMAIQPLNGYVMLGTLVTVTMIAIYLITNITCIVHYSTEGKAQRSVFKHIVAPIVGIAFFVPPLFASVYPVPNYPANLAAPMILAWAVIGTIVYFFLKTRRPEAVQAARRVFVEGD